MKNQHKVWRKEKCGSGWRTVFPVEIKSVTKDKQHQRAQVCAFLSMHWGEVKQQGWKNESKENKLPRAPLALCTAHLAHGAPQVSSINLQLCFSLLLLLLFPQAGCDLPLCIPGGMWDISH